MRGGILGCDLAGMVERKLAPTYVVQYCIVFICVYYARRVLWAKMIIKVIIILGRMPSYILVEYLTIPILVQPTQWSIHCVIDVE